MEDFQKSEKGYISKCFLDFQFSAIRTRKIKDYKMVSQNDIAYYSALRYNKQEKSMIGGNTMIAVGEKLLKGKTFIDLFAGLGGFRLALESLGAECVYSSEWDKAVSQVYYSNFGDYPSGDITAADEKDIPDHDILCAGFPCQAFSISGRQKGFEDSRGTLFFDVARIVKEKQPSIVFMENVKNFASHDKGRTLDIVQNIMEDLGYDFHQKVLSAIDYGVPQKRERIYMVCFRKDLGIRDFQFPRPFKLSRYVEDFLLDEKEIPEDLYVQRDEYIMG